MFRSFSLHKKILFSSLLTSFLFLSILTLVIYYSNEHLESKLLDIQVLSELENISKKIDQSPQFKLPRTAHLSVYLKSRHQQDPLPKFIQKLSLGTHHEIKNNDLLYQITIAPYKDDTIYVLYDITAIEEADNQLSLIIISSWVLLFSMMILLSNYLSRTISQPIQQLRNDLSNIDPDQRGIQLNKEFEHKEIAEIAQAFDRYLDKMDDYVIKQMAFSAMASHELRSPLTVVQTSADLISCIHDDDATLEHVNKIQRSSGNMAKLIHALLHITRDKSAQFEKKNLNLNSLIEHIETNYKVDIKAKKCRIINAIDKKITVYADEILLGVVLSNIIKNAIKFSDHADINIQFKDNSIEIIDAGKGIKQDDIEQVFNFKFKGNKSQGFGIGLYISKLICEHQNWPLEIYKNNHQGVTVKITF